MLSPESHKLASNKKNKLLSEMKEAYEHSNLENKVKILYIFKFTINPINIYLFS